MKLQPRLVACMFASIGVGAFFAGAALVYGFGPLAALALYSLSGSASLVLFAMLAFAHRRPASSVAVGTVCA